MVSGPIFVMGFPRSGTTGLASGLSKLNGISEFSAEGHFIYLFASGIERIASQQVNPNCIVREEAPRRALIQSIATGIDQAYQVATQSKSKQWIDKTPDLQQIQAVPAVMEMFPGAWFFFIYRDPFSSVLSNLRTWPNQLHGKEAEVAQRWARCMEAWRENRPAIPHSQRLEIYQPDLRGRPQAVVRAIGEQMGLCTEDRTALDEFWSANRSMNRPVGNGAKAYDSITLSEEQEEMIRRTCSEEMSHWKLLADFMR